ncbi:MAG TPA: hypothetical protein DCQ36_07615 [Actinobacteria bacterium]|nr:hypothetical protein [Actinomycetota bacterium]
MAAIVVIDESVVVLPRGALGDWLADPSQWRVWWPGSAATVTGRDAGLRWALTGTLVGSSSVTLSEQAEGVLLRYELAADPAEPGSATRPRSLTDSPHARREASALRERHHVAWKRSVFALAARYETSPRKSGASDGRSDGRGR